MKISKRQRRLAAEKELKKPVTAFDQCDLSAASFIPAGMTRAFRNTRFTVMVYDHAKVTTGTACRVMIQKHDDTIFPNHWKEIQQIKNEIFGPETTAVEYFPAESDLIDDHNIYWIWIYPPGVLPLPIINQQ
jgi:hypothetical protein